MPSNNPKVAIMQAVVAGPWGLWVTKDKCFLGDENGPHGYAADYAKIAAAMVIEMIGMEVEVRLLPKEGLVENGEVPFVKTPEEAFDIIEGRT